MTKPHDLLIGMLVVILVVAIGLIIVTYNTPTAIVPSMTGNVVDGLQNTLERREIILPDQERSIRQPYISYPEQGESTQPLAPHMPASAPNTQPGQSAPAHPTPTQPASAHPTPAYSTQPFQGTTVPPPTYSHLPVQIISDFTAKQLYEDARRLIQYSPCYQEFADLRMATLQTGLVGTKFVGPLSPDESYTQFSGVIVVQMRKSHYVVFHDEIPVHVDLSSGQVYCATPTQSASVGGYP